MTVSNSSPEKPIPAPSTRASGRRCLIRRSLRWAEHFLTAIALLGILFVVLPIPERIMDAMDRQGELGRADIIICLGGDPARIIEAARLLQEGYAETLVLSNRAGATELMRETAIEWGAPADHILVDDQVWTTRDHPGSIQRLTGLDPAQDRCIIVTSYTHMARSRACFEKAGYRHITMREPRWERAWRERIDRNMTWRLLILPELAYEGAAWVEYWFRGLV